MVGLGGFEPPTRSLGNCCSIHLSYSPSARKSFYHGILHVPACSAELKVSLASKLKLRQPEESQTIGQNVRMTKTAFPFTKNGMGHRVNTSTAKYAKRGRFSPIACLQNREYVLTLEIGAARPAPAFVLPGRLVSVAA